MLPRPIHAPRALGLLVVLMLPLAAVELELHPVEPCNLLWLGEHQGLSGTLSATDRPTEVLLRVTDYAGQLVLEERRSVDPARGDGQVRWSLASLGSGYYEAMISAGAARAQASFGIAPRIKRSAAEVRAGGYRFGLKMWYLGDAWWRDNAQWNEREAVTATVGLGLQWTRTELRQNAQLPIDDLLTDFPMNAVLKVESFSEDCFDVERYGPLEEWKKINGEAWSKKTVPRKEPYQALLRERLSRIPSEQKVFEIWNEAWDKMPPEDLAKISQMAAEVILAERPDAIIGPNLLGSTSDYAYDARYIEAGGMQGMRMVALHPYGKSEDRAFLRRYQAWLRERCGRDLEIYITEFGGHSTPEGPHQRSEQDQARAVVRQALALYAEGVKALIPHVMGQRERVRTYHEHWMGFYRLNHQPKPNLMAFANCARQIDGSSYRGDLWLGAGIGAMVFQREGVNTLALYTRGETRQLSLQPGAEQVTLVDMVGAQRQVPVVAGGGLALEIGADVLYVVGIGEDLAATASTELDPRRWPQPEKPERNQRSVRTIDRPVFDGDLSDWARAFQIAMFNPKVNGEDASGIGYIAWDRDYLYVAVDMRDNQVLNQQARPKLYRDDSLELFVSLEPRDEHSGYGPKDHQFFITPTSGEGKPIVGHLADREAGYVNDLEAARFHVGPSTDGWVAEVAIPWSDLSDFEPSAGARIALEMRVNDTDTSHERWKIDPEDAGKVDPSNPTTWSIVNLED